MQCAPYTTQSLSGPGNILRPGLAPPCPLLPLHQCAWIGLHRQFSWSGPIFECANKWPCTIWLAFRCYCVWRKLNQYAPYVTAMNYPCHKVWVVRVWIKPQICENLMKRWKAIVTDHAQESRNFKRRTSVNLQQMSTFCSHSKTNLNSCVSLQE